AAQHADIVSILTLGTEAELMQRVQYVKDQAGERLDQIELSFSFGQVSLDDPNDLQILKQVRPDASESQLRSMAILLDGPIEAAAERIARMHHELHISYFTFTITDGTGVTWPTLEKLVARIKGERNRRLGGEWGVVGGALAGGSVDAGGDLGEFFDGFGGAVFGAGHAGDGFFHQGAAEVVGAALEHDLAALDAEFDPAGLD